MPKERTTFYFSFRKKISFEFLFRSWSKWVTKSQLRQRQSSNCTTRKLANCSGVRLDHGVSKIYTFLIYFFPKLDDRKMLSIRTLTEIIFSFCGFFFKINTPSISFSSRLSSIYYIYFSKNLSLLRCLFCIFGWLIYRFNSNYENKYWFGKT